MFTRVIAVQTAKRCVTRPHIFFNAAVKCSQGNRTSIRSFSNEDLKKTLNDINNKYSAKPDTESAGDESAKEGDPSSTTEPSQSASSSNNNNAAPSPINRFMDSLRSSYEVVTEQTKLAWGELTGEKRESVLRRTVEQASSFRPAQKPEIDEEGNEIEKEPEPTGPNAIILVKEDKNYWGQMKDRLQASPLMKEILKNTRRGVKAVAGTDLGKGVENVATSVQDKIHDAREFWETSQNPIVYTLSGLWDNVSGETEEGMATKAIMNLDKNFVKEVWSEEVRTTLAPKILKAHLMGDTAALKPWLGEAVYSKLAADIRARKHDGIVFDHNILELDETQLIMKLMESNSSPVIVVVYMVQQINCIRNRKGEIIEGSETDIRAKFYSMAFQQTYDEEERVSSWKVVDYEFAGDQPYF